MIHDNSGDRKTVPSLSIAEAFIAALTGSSDTSIRLRVFHDSDEANKKSFERAGSIRILWSAVEEYQRLGYGIFYLLNEVTAGLHGSHGSHGFATDKDATGIRALAADHDDGLPETFHLQPTLIVKTSIVDGVQKGQTIWPVIGLAVEGFKPAQRRLAAHYKSDTAICNPSRVLRLPGSLHLKDPANPQLVTFTFNADAKVDALLGGNTADALLEGIPELPAPKPPSPSSGTPVAEKVLREAAGFVDPFEGRPDWLPKAISLRCANIPGDDESRSKARQVLRDWSAGQLAPDGKFTDSNGVYRGEGSVDDLFDTTKPNGAVTLGTFLGAAAKGGWKGDPFDDGKQEEKEKEKEQEGRFEWIEPHQFPNRPAPRWIVDGIIAAKRTHTLFGKSESMKTFQTLDLMGSVAYNTLAFGKFKVYDPGDAIFFCDEDPDDLMLVRYPAWCKARGIENPFATPGRGPGRLIIIPSCPHIIDPTEITTAITIIKAHSSRPKVIAIDTFSKAMVGMNEDSSKDTGLLFEAMGKLRREFDCATWLTHHPKKNEEDEMRGSGAQMHGGDIVWLTQRGANDSLSIQWTNKKMKGGPRPKPINFIGKLWPVAGLLDQHGKQITAPVFNWVEGPAVSLQPGPKLSQAQMEAAASRTLAAEKLTRVRGIILAVFTEHSIVRETALSTKVLADLIVIDEGQTAHDLADARQAMVEYLNKNSPTDRFGPLIDLYKMIKLDPNGDHYRVKRWYQQPWTEPSPGLSPPPAESQLH